MKKRINLLSPAVIGSTVSGNYIKFPLLRGPILVKVGALTLTLLAGLIVYQQVTLGVYKQKVAQSKKKYSNSQGELKQNKDILARLQVEKNNYKRKQKELEDKLGMLSNVTKSESEYSQILAKVAQLVPANLWINKVKLDREKIALVGKALDNSTISNFMVGLDNSDYFEGTTFNYTEKTKVGEKNVIEFEIISQRKHAVVPEKIQPKPQPVKDNIS